MQRKAASATPLLVTLDPASPKTRYRQIFDVIRDGILNGRLGPGLQLPSTRLLATELRVARSTVVVAYEQLIAEGFVTGNTGSGTFVARDLPDLRLRRGPPPAARRPPSTERRRLSARAASYLETSIGAPFSNGVATPFRLGEPAVDAFPLKTWRRLTQRRWRTGAPELLRYGGSEGYRPLREALLRYLGASRGVHATLEQVILVRGTQQAIDLTCRVLLDPGDAVWVEDPGYLSTLATLRTAGARVVPVPVDTDGLDVRVGERLEPAARAAFVAPSHQYPLGVTMTLARRLELLAWARRAGAWIVEDDFDSEFRYAGQPLLALQGLDTSDRVLYVGTFSKTLFPALRLAYLVVPPDLVAPFARARAIADYVSPSVEQAVIADFITDGHFARHVRRMRALYASRQAALVEAVTHELPDLMRTEAAPAGMHLLAWLREDLDDAAACAAAESVGIESAPLSRYRLQATHPPALLLGYASVNERAIAAAVRRLGPPLRACAAGRSLRRV